MPEEVVEKVKVNKAVPNLIKPVHPVNKRKMNFLLILPFILVIAAGIFVGWKLSGAGNKKLSANSNMKEPSGVAVTSAPQATGGDCAQGNLVFGGIQGEGTYHLDRDLGAEKYVYLTSTTVDLGGMVGKKVEVCGVTIQARHAGWLIDVTSIRSL